MMNFLDNLDKKNLLISILALIFSTNVIDITMIGIDTYYIIYKLKKSQIFIIFIKDLEYLIEKKS